MSARWLACSQNSRTKGWAEVRSYQSTDAPSQAARAQRDISDFELHKELGIERVTLYRYVGSKVELRDYGIGVLGFKTL